MKIVKGDILLEVSVQIPDPELQERISETLGYDLEVMCVILQHSPEVARKMIKAFECHLLAGFVEIGKIAMEAEKAGEKIADAPPRFLN